VFKAAGGVAEQRVGGRPKKNRVGLVRRQKNSNKGISAAGKVMRRQASWRRVKLGVRTCGARRRSLERAASKADKRRRPQDGGQIRPAGRAASQESRWPRVAVATAGSQV